MKFRKTLPAIYAILFGVALILFFVWFTFIFDAKSFYVTEEGIPLEYGVTNKMEELRDSSAKPPFYKIMLNNSARVFALSMYGQNFNFKKMDSLMATGKKTVILFHDEKNEYGQFDIYKISQEGKDIYTFNKHFTAGSSKITGWIVLITGITFVLLGTFSFYWRIRQNEK